MFHLAMHLCTTNFLIFLVTEFCHWPIRSRIKGSDCPISLRHSRPRKSESYASAVKSRWPLDIPAQIPFFSAPLLFLLLATNSRNTWGLGGVQELLPPKLTWVGFELLPPNFRTFLPFSVIFFQEVAFQKYTTLLNNYKVKHIIYTNHAKKGVGRLGRIIAGVCMSFSGCEYPVSSVMPKTYI